MEEHQWEVGFWDYCPAQLWKFEESVRIKAKVLHIRLSSIYLYDLSVERA